MRTHTYAFHGSASRCRPWHAFFDARPLRLHRNSPADPPTSSGAISPQGPWSERHNQLPILAGRSVESHGATECSGLACRLVFLRSVIGQPLRSLDGSRNSGARKTGELGKQVPISKTCWAMIPPESCCRSA